MQRGQRAILAVQTAACNLQELVPLEGHMERIAVPWRHIRPHRVTDKPRLPPATSSGRRTHARLSARADFSATDAAASMLQVPTQGSPLLQQRQTVEA